MATLKTASGSIEVSGARIVRQAERMGKLSEPRRAHRLEKAKAALAGGEDKGSKAGAGGKAKGKGGKGKAAKARDISPAVRQAAAIVLSQGINEL